MPGGMSGPVVDSVDNVENPDRNLLNTIYKNVKTCNGKVLRLSVYFCRKMRTAKRNPQPKSAKNVDKVVDNVNNQWETMDSATLTISPAPIVINKSSGLQWANKNFSISSKV